MQSIFFVVGSFSLPVCVFPGRVKSELIRHKQKTQRMRIHRRSGRTPRAYRRAVDGAENVRGMGTAVEQTDCKRTAGAAFPLGAGLGERILFLPAFAAPPLGPPAALAHWTRDTARVDEKERVAQNINRLTGQIGKKNVDPPPRGPPCRTAAAHRAAAHLPPAACVARSNAAHFFGRPLDVPNLHLSMSRRRFAGPLRKAASGRPVDVTAQRRRCLGSRRATFS